MELQIINEEMIRELFKINVRSERNSLIGWMCVLLHRLNVFKEFLGLLEQLEDERVVGEVLLIHYVAHESFACSESEETEEGGKLNR